MSGIDLKYSVLLTLSLEQLYYQNRICPRYMLEPVLDFTLQPTVECMLTMNRLGMVYKPNDRSGGFVVAAAVAGANPGGDDLLRAREKSSDKLTFLVLMKNAEMLNINDLTTGIPDNTVFFFSNQVADAAASRDDLHLTTGAAGVKVPDDILKISSSRYQYLHSTVVNANSVKVRHMITGTEIKPSTAEILAGRSQLTFDLTLLPSGKCTLLVSNVAIETFYYLNETLPRSLSGVIELSLSNLTAANYRLIEPDHSLPLPRPTYKIRFLNRKVRWRYTVYVSANSALYLEMTGLNAADKADFMNRINILSNDTALTFSPKSLTDSSFVFESDMPRLLQEKYLSSTSANHDPLNLVLKKYIGNAARESNVKPDLPFPDASSIDISTYPNEYSNVYITL
jgi:hypothetical protein